jgi:hypothetical protein
VWDIVQKRPYRTGVLAAGRLDFDDIRTQIAYQLAAELTFLIGQLQHSESRQWPSRAPRRAHIGSSGHRSVSSI